MRNRTALRRSAARNWVFSIRIGSQRIGGPPPLPTLPKGGRVAFLPPLRRGGGGGCSFSLRRANDHRSRAAGLQARRAGGVVLKFCPHLDLPGRRIDRVFHVGDPR